MIKQKQRCLAHQPCWEEADLPGTQLWLAGQKGSLLPAPGGKDRGTGLGPAPGCQGGEFDGVPLSSHCSLALFFHGKRQQEAVVNLPNPLAVYFLLGKGGRGVGFSLGGDAQLLWCLVPVLGSRTVVTPGALNSIRGNRSSWLAIPLPLHLRRATGECTCGEGWVGGKQPSEGTFTG